MYARMATLAFATRYGLFLLWDASTALLSAWPNNYAKSHKAAVWMLSSAGTITMAARC